MGYEGAEWIERTFGIIMSGIGRESANLLGDVFRGIYHLNYTSLSKVNWSHPYFIQFTCRDPLATYDGDELTRLIILAHDRMMRVEITGAAPNYLRLGFSKRTTREGGVFSSRMPTIEKHIEAIRIHYASEYKTGIYYDEEGRPVE